MSFKFDPCSICVWAFEPNSWNKRLRTCKLIPWSRDSCVFIKNACGPQAWSMWSLTWAFETNPWRRQWATKPVSCHDEYVSNILECVDYWAKAQPSEKRNTSEVMSDSLDLLIKPRWSCEIVGCHASLPCDFSCLRTRLC